MHDDDIAYTCIIEAYSGFMDQESRAKNTTLEPSVAAVNKKHEVIQHFTNHFNYLSVLARVKFRYKLTYLSCVYFVRS